MMSTQEIFEMLQVIYSIVGESCVREASDDEIAGRLGEELKVVQLKLEIAEELGYVRLTEEHTFGSRYRVGLTDSGRKLGQGVPRQEP